MAFSRRITYKFEKKTTENIFNFMKNFFNKKNKSLPWEAVLNTYIKKTGDSFFILRNQNYYWKNINTVNDYIIAKSNGRKNIYEK